MDQRAWHTLQISDVLRLTASSTNGLSAEEAEQRLKQQGLNALREARVEPAWRIFLEQFIDPLIYILLIAAAVTLLLREFLDAGVIMAAVTINAIIGTVQRVRAEKAIASLKELTAPVATVRRDGIEQEIDARSLVLGDIVLLDEGMKVPADLRLFETAELSIDESALTGEAMPAEKISRPLTDEKLTPGDQVNMAFLGTVVTGGAGEGVVVETGMRTQFGQISRQVTEIQRELSPLEKRIGRFGRLVGFGVLGLAVLVFMLGLLTGETFANTLLLAVSVTVAAVPEGLPVVVTIALAVGISRMARRKAIIRRLAAVETLGSCTIACSDKTGTLTENQMTVQRLWVVGHIFTFNGAGYTPAGDIVNHGDLENYRDRVDMALRIGVLCNNARLASEGGDWRIYGDPTEAALLVAAEKAGLNRFAVREQFPRVGLIPFKSERRYMATLHHTGEGSMICLKGSVERVLRVADDCYQGCPLSIDDIRDAADEFSAEGLRVLALAIKETPERVDEITSDDIDAGGYSVSGLVGIMDPPRPAAIEAVGKAHDAGVRVAMITGDHALTAVAVARQLGIGDPNPDVLTGSQLEYFSDEELQAILPHISVYARTAPQHKFRLVRLLRQSGEVVAVTGDGVNDAPALRAGDIGVAMGKAGTDVAKEASDMVLADDNFATIINAVEEGRAVFLNIRKVLMFLAVAALGLVLTVIAGIFIQDVFLLLPAQILWINLAQSALTDVALATEPGEPGLLKQPPRPVNAPIITRRMWRQITLVSLYQAAAALFVFTSALEQTGSVSYAQTMAVNVLVLTLLAYVLEARSFDESIFRLNPLGNKFLFVAVLTSLVAQLAFIYLPAFNLIFNSTPLNAGAWGINLLISLGVIVVVEIEKLITRRLQRKPDTREELPFRLPADARPRRRE